MQGDKADVQNKPQAFVDKGFVFVSTNYRLFPNVSIKTMAGDVAKAIRWTHDHATDFGGDPRYDFRHGTFRRSAIGRVALHRRELS